MPSKCCQGCSSRTHSRFPRVIVLCQHQSEAFQGFGLLVLTPSRCPKLTAGTPRPLALAGTPGTSCDLCGSTLNPKPSTFVTLDLSPGEKPTQWVQAFGSHGNLENHRVVSAISYEVFKVFLGIPTCTASAPCHTPRVSGPQCPCLVLAIPFKTKARGPDLFPLSVPEQHIKGL